MSTPCAAHGRADIAVETRLNGNGPTEANPKHKRRQRKAGFLLLETKQGPTLHYFCIALNKNVSSKNKKVVVFK